MSPILKAAAARCAAATAKQKPTILEQATVKQWLMGIKNWHHRFGLKATPGLCNQCQPSGCSQGLSGLRP